MNPVVLLYLGLLAWQPLWLWLLPQPWGYGSALLAALFTLLLLPPLPGLLRNRYSSSIWGAYISLAPFLFAVMELYAAPQRRWAAAIQLSLILGYWLTLILRRAGSR